MTRRDRRQFGSWELPFRQASDDLDREFVVACLLRSRRHLGVKARRRLLGDRSCKAPMPGLTSSRIASSITGSGIMEAISEGARLGGRLSGCLYEFRIELSLTLVPACPSDGRRSYAPWPWRRSIRSAPKRRRRRVDAIISKRERLRKCSRDLILPIG